ncbi:MFS transporter [Dactylosporangium sp. McL0621]|uniref:MFS transporter n=1 Tax=Dactylosporangium sp. McL0621 TaxID=3415678 RepID=UPI003CF7CD62
MKSLTFAAGAMLVSYLPFSAVNGALGAIAAATGAGTLQLQWVSDAFAVALAAVVLPAGVLADRVGHRLVTLLGLAGTVLGAAAGTVAGQLDGAAAVVTLWVAQAVAGVGAGAVMSASLALIAAQAPDPRRRARWISLWAAATVGGLGGGPFLTGAVTAVAGWWWLYPPIALLAVAAAAAGFGVAESRAPERRRPDAAGLDTAAHAAAAPERYGPDASGLDAAGRLNTAGLDAAGLDAAGLDAAGRLNTARLTTAGLDVAGLDVAGRLKTAGLDTAGRLNTAGLDAPGLTTVAPERHRPDGTGPATSAPERRGLDGTRHGAAAIGVAALVFAVIGGGTAGWASPATLAAAAVAVLAFAALAAIERRAESPLLPLSLFASRGFAAAALAATVVLFAIGGGLFFLSLTLSHAHVGQLGIALRLGGLFGGNALGSVAAGWLQRRLDGRTVLLAGLVVAAAGAASLLTVGGASGAELTWRLAVLGLGAGLVMATSSAVAVQSVPAQFAGLAGAASNAVRQIGAALGPAVLGGVLAARSTTGLAGAVHAFAAVLTAALALTALVAAALIHLRRAPRAA